MLHQSAHSSAPLKGPGKLKSNPLMLATFFNELVGMRERVFCITHFKIEHLLRSTNKYSPGELKCIVIISLF